MSNFHAIMKSIVSGVLLLAFTGGVAEAAEGLDTGDTAWILTSTALVLFMTLPGLALFYAGLVRARNVLSVLMHCFAIACLASVLWLVGVYSLAFGDGGSANGGGSGDGGRARRPSYGLPPTDRSWDSRQGQGGGFLQQREGAPCYGSHPGF